MRTQLSFEKEIEMPNGLLATVEAWADVPTVDLGIGSFEFWGATGTDVCECPVIDVEAVEIVQVRITSSNNKALLSWRELDKYPNVRDWLTNKAASDPDGWEEVEM
jgi:hypothetical protein